MVVKVEKSPASAENRSSIDTLWKETDGADVQRLATEAELLDLSHTEFLSLAVHSLPATPIYNVRFPQRPISLHLPTENATGSGTSDPEKQKTRYQVTHGVSHQCC